MKINKITRTLKKQPTFDIEVDETHNYLIRCGDNMVISHNSSVCQNQTNGIEPIKAIVTYKSSKAGSPPMIAPGSKINLKNYTFTFDKDTNEGYLKVCGVLQKWTDMAISVNLNYSPKNFPDGKIPYMQIIKDHLTHYKLGGKTIYYINTDDENDHNIDSEKSGCSGGACSI